MRCHRVVMLASLVAAVSAAPAVAATIDGDLSDIAALGPPLAVSAADGPGAGPPADFGIEGTITELYARPVASAGSGPVDSLWIGIRGDFFGTSATANDVFLAIDVTPGTAGGITQLGALFAQGGDDTGVVDRAITFSQVELAPSLVGGAGVAIDAVLGVTDSSCATADVCGLRSFGTDGTTGSFSDYAWSSVAIAQGSGNAGLAAAPGASYPAPDAIEALIPLADLGDPGAVALAAWVASDTGFPSPNTLPENASDTFESPQLIEAVAYLYVAEPIPLFGGAARTVVVLTIGLAACWPSAYDRVLRPAARRVPWRSRAGRG